MVESHPNHRYPHEVFTNLSPETGIKLIIPINFMAGRQPTFEYASKKINTIANEYQTHGPTYLREYPIWLCALPIQAGFQLVIYDGHHRVRYGPKYGITHFPSIVFTPEQIAQAQNIPVDVLVAQLSAQVRDTTDSFSRIMGPKFQPPQPVTTLSQLNKLRHIWEKANVNG